MKKYRLKIKLNTIFIVLLLYSPFILLSQIKLNEENVSIPFIKITDEIFSKLDMEKIPSGILLDKTPVLSNFSLYSGDNIETYISSDTLLQLYSELYYAHFEKEELDDVFSFQEKAKKFSKTNKNTIPIGLLFYDYQKLLPEAVENGDFVAIDGFVIDNTGVGETPYSNEIIFAMAPLLNVNSKEKIINLTIDENFIKNNKSFTKIQIKTTKNGIWEDVEFGEIISLKNSLLKEDIIMNFKIFADNNIFYCSSIIPMINKEGKIEVIQPDDIIYLGNENQGGIWLGCNNNEIRKPIVMIEGYDPGDERDFKSDKEDKNLYHLMNANNMADDFRNMGFDLIILNFGDGLRPMEVQAEVVEELITEVNNRLANNNSYHEIILIAPSQGGVVSRYALCTMENEGIDHRVKLFIPFDSPHKGANIPLALQHLVRFTYNSLPLFWLGEIKKIKEIMNATPTKQLLYYHHSQTNNQIASPAAEFDIFYNKLHNLNENYGYPTKCRNIAIANGSANGTKLEFDPGDLLFSTSTFFGAYWSFITVGYAVPDIVKHVLFKGETYFMGIPSNLAYYKIKSTKPYDNCAGGTNNLLSTLFEGNDWLGTSYYDSFSFIPTTSSLDFIGGDGINFNYYSVFGNQEFSYVQNLSYLPFEAVYISLENEPHVIGGITNDIIDFSTNNVMPEDLFLQDRTIQYKADFEALNEIKAGKDVTELLFSHDFIVSDNAEVSFVASNKITLEPGFSTLSGAHFDARIEDISCSKIINSKQNSNNSSSYFSEKGIDFLKSIVMESDNTNIIFPNPSKGVFNIQIGDFASDKLKVEVLNMNGIIVYSSFNKESNSLSINITDQPPGVYFIKLISNTEQRTYKVFKQ